VPLPWQGSWDRPSARRKRNSNICFHALLSPPRDRKRGNGLGLSLVAADRRRHGGDAVARPWKTVPRCFLITLAASLNRITISARVDVHDHDAHEN